ncbi:MAG: hypothetical protein DSY47_05655 [Hydrogenothermus sp.]|nr:MAG: hypothetical protein DSY47_05655 [Hydrogenothermus sp.]
MKHIKIDNLNILYTEKGEDLNFVLQNFNFSEIKLPKQIHSNFIKDACEADLECDALYTDKKNLPIGVKTADCVPIVITDFKKVAVIHAGWRGIVGGIIENTLKIFDEPKFAYIAPSIRKCCYEIGEDFYENLKKDYENYFYKKSGKLYFSLQEAVIDKLKQYTGEILENHRCTYCDNKLYSYRKGNKTERILTIAWLEE